MLRSIGFGNSYFRAGTRSARRIPSFPLQNTTSDFNGTIFSTGKLVDQWNAAKDITNISVKNDSGNSVLKPGLSDNLILILSSDLTFKLEAAMLPGHCN